MLGEDVAGPERCRISDKGDVAGWRRVVRPKRFELLTPKFVVLGKLLSDWVGEVVFLKLTKRVVEGAEPRDRRPTQGEIDHATIWLTLIFWS